MHDQPFGRSWAESQNTAVIIITKTSEKKESTWYLNILPGGLR